MIQKIASIILVFALAFSSSPGLTEEPTNYCLDIPKEYENIQEMIKTTNDMNRDFGLDKPVITKEGILQDNEPECRALLDRIELDMDMALDGLQHYKGVKFSQKDRKAPEYKQFFNKTEVKIYEVMTGRSYPK